MNLSLLDDYNIIKEHLSIIHPQYLIGTDEAGRGPLAGPLVVAGVLFEYDTKIDCIFDSKKISEKKRKELALEIKSKALAYHIEIVSLEDIEKFNIYQASKWGMIRCFQEITKQLVNISCSILLTDAMKISSFELPNTEIISLIKGDQKSFHIAAASILAKTARDDIMIQLHYEYPCYQWDKNKGYPTKFHRTALKEYGISKYHRKGFKLG